MPASTRSPPCPILDPPSRPQPSPTRFAAWPWLAFTIQFALVVILVSPRYEVPQNDDWAYHETIRQWMVAGSLPDLGWNDPTLLLQLAWGRLFAEAFGLSYTALRISTLLLAWIGGLALIALLRRCGASPLRALAGAMLVVFNPVALVAAYSFNSDVPYVALATLATAILLRGADERSLRWIALAGLVTAAAFLVRQQGALLAAAAAAWFVLRRDEGPRRRAWTAAAAMALPTLVAMVGHAAWLRAVRTGSWLPQFSVLRGEGSVERAAALGLAAFGSFAALALWLLPVAIAAAWVWRCGRFAPPLRPLALLFGTLALAGGAAAACAMQPDWLRGFPWLGPYFTRCGALPLRLGPDQAVGSAAMWNGATLLLLPTGLWLASVLARSVRAIPRRPVALVALLGVAQLAPAVLVAEFYDRYLLVALPAVLLLAFEHLPPLRGERLLLATTLLSSAFAAEWLRAYVDRAEARWSVAEELVVQGVAPGQIAAGFEWGGTHLYLEACRTLRLRPPFRDWSAGPPWAPLQEPRVFLVEVEVRPRKTLAYRAFRPLFARTSREVVAVARRQATGAAR